MKDFRLLIFNACVAEGKFEIGLIFSPKGYETAAKMLEERAAPNSANFKLRSVSDETEALDRLAEIVWAERWPTMPPVVILGGVDLEKAKSLSAILSKAIEQKNINRRARDAFFSAYADATK